MSKARASISAPGAPPRRRSRPTSASSPACLRHPRLAATAGLLLATVLAAGSPELPPIPHPALDGLQPPIRRGIETLEKGYEEKLRNPEAPREELAAAAGRLGAVYHAHAFPEAAEAAYTHARLLTPDDPRWAYYLAFLLNENRRFAEAADQFDAVLAKFPRDLATLIRAGHAKLDAGRPEDARRDFETALDVAPGTAAPHFGLGRVAAAAGDPQGAIVHFEKTLEIQPDASVAHYPLGLAYRQIRDLDKARLHLGLRGEGRVEFDDPLLDQLSQIPMITVVNVVLSLAADDESFSAPNFLGYAVTQLGDKGGTVEYLLKAVAEKEKADTPGTELERARILYAAGGLLAYRERFDEAVVPLRRAVELAPEFWEARLELAQALLRAEHYDAAVVELDAVLETKPDRPAVLRGRATARIRGGHDADAVADLVRLTEVEPESGAARLQLAMVLQRLERDDEARARYREALERELDDGARSLAHGNLAMVLARRGDLEEAAEHFASALLAGPAAPELELAFADTLGLLDRYDEAAGHYAAVAAAAPRNVAAHRGRAGALIFAGRYADAVRALEEARRDLPEHPLFAHLLARLLAAAPSADLRDGERAVALARPLFEERKTLLHGEALAMALAEAGRWIEAAELQRALIASAESRGAPRSAARLRANLERYESGRSCCAQEPFVVLLPRAEGDG